MCLRLAGGGPRCPRIVATSRLAWGAGLMRGSVISIGSSVCLQWHSTKAPESMDSILHRISPTTCADLASCTLPARILPLTAVVRRVRSDG